MHPWAQTEENEKAVGTDCDPAPSAMQTGFDLSPINPRKARHRTVACVIQRGTAARDGLIEMEREKSEKRRMEQRKRWISRTQ